MSLWFKKVLWNIFFTEILTSHSLLTNKSSSHGIEKTVVARRKKRERFSLVLDSSSSSWKESNLGLKWILANTICPLNCLELPRKLPEIDFTLPFYPVFLPAPWIWSTTSRRGSSSCRGTSRPRARKSSSCSTGSLGEHFYSGWPNMRADIRLVWPIFLALNCWTY